MSEPTLLLLEELRWVLGDRVDILGGLGTREELGGFKAELETLGLWSSPTSDCRVA